MLHRYLVIIKFRQDIGRCTTEWRLYIDRTVEVWSCGADRWRQQSAMLLMKLNWTDDDVIKRSLGFDYCRPVVEWWVFCLVSLHFTYFSAVASYFFIKFLLVTRFPVFVFSIRLGNPIRYVAERGVRKNHRQRYLHQGGSVLSISSLCVG